MVFQIPFIGYVIAIFLFFAVKVVRNKYFYGLSAIPGPKFAALTNLWRLKLASTWKSHSAHIELHQRYGKVVRLGPNLISTTDWNAVKKIYGPGSRFMKSDYYPVLQNTSHGKIVENLFDTQNGAFHMKAKRMLSGPYSMSGVVQLEPLVDDTIADFFTELDSRFKDQPISVPFHKWLQYFAFDVIGSITFSKKFGFLANGYDPIGLIDEITLALKYFAVIGQMPWLDHLLLKNPIRLGLARLGLLDSEPPVFAFTAKEIKRSIHEFNDEGFDQSRPTQNFVLQFMKSKSLDPEFMTDSNTLNFTNMNVFAGSDTTGITLTALFYYLTKNQDVLEKLVQEVDSVSPTRDDGIFTWAEARALPYLTAVVNEALRIHPAVGLLLERVVPEGGLQIGSHFLPKGTVVGANAWALHQNESMFGSDTARFKPERWLEASQQKQLEMRNALFSFGLGSRTCIGRNISLLEIYKLVPSLIRRYQVCLVDPDSEWTTENYWLVKQADFNVYIKSRRTTKPAVVE